MKLDLSRKTMDIGTFAFNFVRTLMVAGTGGAELSECLLAAEAIEEGDLESWVHAWAALATQTRDTATRALESGQPATARSAWLRASNYFRSAMFSLPPADPRLERYLTASRECFHAAAPLCTPPIEPLDITFGEARLPAYFVPAGGPRRPTLVVLNGGDSTNEELVHWLGFAAVARGWNCLVFEGPGQWSALQRNPGLLLRPDYEVPVKAVLDELVRRPEVDAERLALFGPSLGSLLAARVAAFEPRIKACVCDGLVVDVYEAWHSVWPAALRHSPPALFDLVFGALERLSPQLRGLANHFRFMLGVARPSELIAAWKPYDVRALAPRIHCPMLVLYGEAEAAQAHEQVGLSALRFISELGGPATVRMFDYGQGWAASHCHIGGLAPMQAVVFDWLERAVSAPERLPRRDLGENVEPIFRRHLRTAAGRRQVEALLPSLRATVGGVVEG